MDHEEFARKVNASDAIQRWVHSIPLHHVIADGLPICPALGNDALRAVSQLSEEEIDNLVETAISSGIKTMLKKSVVMLSESFAALDQRVENDKKKQAEAAGAAAGGGGSGKFDAVATKLASGNIDDFHSGLAERVGEISSLTNRLTCLVFLHLI